MLEEAVTPLSIQQKLASMRLKLAKGELTDEELREALVLLRRGRESAAIASSKSKAAKAAAAPIDTDALLSQMLG